MNEKVYPRIGERVLEKTLPNGLKIFIVPKPQHRKKYAFFATRYGGMDMQFIRNGKKCDTPAGIAHYLEHKMFDTEDGNALQQFSQNGAEPNAFTSNAMTGYYFDCTEHFEENLRILLSFVSVPYFTEESVEKERGIIAQEIRMVEDSPDWQVYETSCRMSRFSFEGEFQCNCCKRNIIWHRFITRMHQKCSINSFKYSMANHNRFATALFFGRST